MHKIKNIEKQLKSNISPIKNVEMISIRKAAGRYLADNVYSSINIPPANNSAVDGYLFRFKELRDATTKEFIINSEISAGEMLTDIYSSKIAIKISTGGHIPKGFDAVVMEEDFNINKNSIILNKKKELFRWMNIRKKAEDIKRNEKVFSAGHLLRAQDVGMLSSLGISKLHNIKQRIKKKRQIFHHYYKNLKNIKEIKMFKFQKDETPWFVDIYLKNPKKLQEYLKEFNISTRLVYPPLNSLKIFKIKGNFENSTYYCNRGLWLPSSINLKEKDIKFIVNKIKIFLNNYAQN